MNLNEGNEPAMKNNVPLDDVCEVMSGNAWPASRFNFNGKGLPVIRIQNMEGDNAGKSAYWDDEFDSRYLITEGDLLLSLSGSFKVVRWTGGKSLLNQRIMKLTPDSQRVDCDFLLFQLQFRLSEIEAAATSTAIKNTSLTFLRGMLLWLPRLEEQRRIVSLIMECMEKIAEIEQLKGEILKEQIVLSDLREAILRKAFAGEL